MKKTFLALFAVAVLLGAVAFVVADKPTSFDSKGNEIGWANSNSDCATIQDGTLVDSAGNPIEMGFDKYGYNYQAHMFNGFYDNYARPANPVTEGDKLIMKWSDSWLANVDCDGDGKLDRGLVNGEASGISMGWLTNHLEGDYTDTDGNVQHYTDFVKIVWTGPGSPLWGQYTITEEVYNDPSAGFNGLLTKTTPGFGLNNQWTTM